MVDRLRRNLDVIEYLLHNATSDQWCWRHDGTGWSLGEIIRHLRNVERCHVDLFLSDYWVEDRPDPVTTDANRDVPKATSFVSGYRRAFEEFTYLRKETIKNMRRLSSLQWQSPAVHQVFGRVTGSDLVEKIDEHDRAHIEQLEGIMQAMPVNPLVAQALHEIAEYHRRYQPYLVRAGSVLDIGVGPGLALRHIMRENPQLSFAGVDVRDIRFPETGVPLQVYDGHTLPFCDKRFGVSLLFYVLHHCQDPARVLSEAVRVSRDYLIIIEEFNQGEADEASLDLTERQSHRALGIPTDLPYQLFDKATLEAMFQKNRLTEFEQQPLPSHAPRPVQKYLYVVGVGK